jgi:hypothetical protein
MNSNQQKHMLANEGVDITGKVVTRITRSADRQALKEANAKFQTVSKEKITDRIQGMLAVLAIFFVGAFLVAGNIATIIMFPIAEFVAVRRGIMAFEAQPFIASFNAATIVVGYVVLLFIKNALRDNLPSGGGYSTIHSLYRSTRWTILFIQISIILFGFLGRASDNLMSGEPIGVVEIIGYSGTLILTMALLAVTDITVLFVYSIFTNNVGVLNLASGDRSAYVNFLEARSEELKVEKLADLLIMAQQENRQKEL